MTFSEGLYLLIYGPLELLFELVFGISLVFTGNAGLAIIPLSLYMNLLTLPFYNRADEIQRKEWERQQRLAPGVEHIKKTFRSAERYMMLQAFYRVNGYKPVYALRGSLPLLLQIPFFIAAFHFLSNSPYLYGARFGVLANLGEPDRLLSIRAVSVNLLPFLMTFINILSSSVYTRIVPQKDKNGLYTVAFVFLVFLYASPAGLVFYWTLNNLFSLCKNLVCFVKKNGCPAKAALSAFGALFWIFGCALYRSGRLEQWAQIVLVLVIGAVCQIPVLTAKTGKEKAPETNPAGTDGSEAADSHREKNGAAVFVSGCLFLAVLTGLLIPSSVIRSSPAEFVAATGHQSPLFYVCSAFLLAASAFLLWGGLFYYLAGDGIKRAMRVAVWILSGGALVNYMLFGTNLGNLSAELKYDFGLDFSTKECFLNMAVLVLVGAAMFMIWKKKPVVVRMTYPVLISAVLIMSVRNIADITLQMPRIRALLKQKLDEKASFALSRNGKNVIVFMLDRSISGYVPYLFRENSELARQWEGFTWYPNTLSYGMSTNTASASIFGGYEYTPEEMNKRDKEPLADKQNEALKVLPVLFGEAGYEVTVCDPPYAGYSWIPDLSVYDGYDYVRAFHTENGQFRDLGDSMGIKQQIWKRNFFLFGMMKISPLFMQSGLYQDGKYFNPYKIASMQRMPMIQGRPSPSVSVGYSRSFTDAYAVLRSLPDMTRVTDEPKNTFMMIDNDATHNAIMLQEPQYEPAQYVNNVEYDRENIGRFTVDGRTMIANTSLQMSHYQVNMAAFIRLGKWFDYLREQGVYDNTRIIVVSDHGWSLEQFGDMLFGKKGPQTDHNPEDVMAYNPLLMVKDFGSRAFAVDKRFMTNADTPLLSMDRLIEKPVNPFTKKPMTNDAKYADEQHVFYSDDWIIDRNNGNKFLPGIWYSLKNQNIFDMRNWKKIGEY